MHIEVEVTKIQNSYTILRRCSINLKFLHRHWCLPDDKTPESLLQLWGKRLLVKLLGALRFVEQICNLSFSKQAHNSFLFY